MVTGGVAVFVLLVIGFLSIMISRGIAVPLSGISQNMNLSAEGKRDIRVDYTDQKSEIGELARSMQVFQSKSEEMVGLRQQQIANEQ